MISCADFMAEMGNYLEGDVELEVRGQLELHLSHCRTCQVVYDSTRKTLRVVTDSGSFELPAAASRAVVEGVMARIRAGQVGVEREP